MIQMESSLNCDVDRITTSRADIKSIKEIPYSNRYKTEQF